MITPLSSFSSRRILCAAAATLFGLAVSAAASAATLTVDSTSDLSNPGGGACSLRGAVAAVNNAVDGNGCTAVGTYGTSDTIIFAASVSGTIPFTSEITISKNLTITGPGAAVLALDGGGTTRLLYVNGGTALTVTGLTLQNSYNIGSGGAIEVGVGGHALTVRDSVFSGNRAGYGGAIDINAFSSTLAMENCTFTGNTANDGGAIYASTATVSASTFTGNTANDDGGAIWARTATVSTSTFTGNTADYWGGAIRADSATVSASTFTGNTATTLDGGAIYAFGTAVTASTFTGNTAGHDGGAVWILNAGTVTDSTFTGNEAGNEGGAVWAANAAVSTSTFAENTAVTDGGAIRAAGAIIDASTFLGNTADSRGGAIYGGFLTGNGLTLVNNIAPTGAAVYNDTGSISALNNSLVAGDATVTTPHCAAGNGAIGGANLEWRNGSNTSSCGSAAVAVPTTITTLAAIVSTTLADNGGPTETLILPAGSPAIGAANATTAATAPSTPADQRGVARGPAPDLGAFEAVELDGTMPDGTINLAYSGSVAAYGGTAPYISYTLTSGSLPPGLILNTTTGAVSGTPGTAGTYTFTITTTDTPGATASRSFTVTILGGPPPPPSGATAIPALGPLPLLALIGLLGGAGVMRRRR